MNCHSSSMSLGDMSLVGPRPEKTVFVEKFKRRDTALYDQASSKTGHDRLGAGKRIQGIPRSANVLTVIYTILRTGQWDWISRFYSLPFSKVLSIKTHTNTSDSKE